MDHRTDNSAGRITNSCPEIRDGSKLTAARAWNSGARTRLDCLMVHSFLGSSWTLRSIFLDHYCPTRRTKRGDLRGDHEHWREWHRPACADDYSFCRGS